MMQDYGTLPATRNSRNTATVVITPQNSLAESAKVFLVLPLERVTVEQRPCARIISFPHRQSIAL
jgi:hypothetical protein